MTTPESSSSASPASSGTMIICPTTHNDWDWQVTFETYYNDGTIGGSNGPTQSVRKILESVALNLSSADPDAADFRFSYAEVGYLRQYLEDHPHMAGVFQNAVGRFYLLGGGITSPDNQACHGEVFIRNYLTGHEYLRSVGLIGNVSLVAWLPDDFGHDPQLPVLVEALGMNAIGLSRIPGSPQPTLCPSKQPANATVRADGLSFYWPASDGSKVLTHFMPSTYYGITNYGTSDAQSAMNGFLAANNPAAATNASQYANWPGGTVFATQGGDWQFPTNAAPDGTFNGWYDWQGVIGATATANGIALASQLGTFEDYYNALMETPSEIPTFELYAENYWTGYFASRPQLKIDHYKAAQLLLGAETLGSILALRGGTTPQQRLDMAGAIAKGWRLLVPSTHHDFITGTSPDSVYVVGNPTGDTWDAKGQLPMTAQARGLAAEALEAGMTQLADAAEADPVGANEISVVIFNQLGLDLPDTAIVEMDDPGNGATTDYEVRVGASVGPVQRIAGNRLIFQVPGMKSMEYRVVYLIPLNTITAVPEPEDAGALQILNNGLVHLELSQDVGWAIKTMMVDGTNRVQPNSDYANRLSLWTDSGNLYQFGMEFLPNNCTNGTFSHSTFMTGASGSVVEKGPIRWRFIGQLTCVVQGVTYNYTTQYDLINGEKLVRITTIGAAPTAMPPGPPTWSPVGWSVLASFPMQTASRGLPAILEYGTSYYWENRNPQGPSWSASGMTFRACHDFAQIATGTLDTSGNADPVDAVAAVYHNGMPAWSIDGTIMYGCVLRNAPGNQRGANGTDTDIHIQSYTLDVESQLAATGYPLQTALYAHTPLHAKPVNMYVPPTAPVRAELASVKQSDAVIRVAKMNTSAEDGRSLILRVQRSGTGTETLDIDLPFLASGGTIVWPSIVTALETIPDNPPAVTLSGTTASFQADRALWTMKVPITLPETR